MLGLRPEDLHLAEEPGARALSSNLPVKVEVVEPLGSETLLYWRTLEETSVARVLPTDSIDVGQTIDLLANLSRAHFFDPQTGETLLSWPA